MRNTVLFLCTGNLCRSVIAEGVLKKKLAKRGITDVLAHSAGVRALAGQPAADLAVRVAAQRDVDLSKHLARQVTQAMLEEADLVVVMESIHLDTCNAIVKDRKGKYRLLSHFGPKKTSGADIADPYGHSCDVFLSSYEEIERCVEGLLDYLVGQWKLKPAMK